MNWIWYMAYFLVGCIGTLMLMLWVMGSVARTWLVAKLLKRKVAIIPRLDRGIDFKIIPKAVLKGKFLLKPYGVLILVPSKTYTTKDFVGTAIWPDGVSLNYTGDDAEVCERKAKGEKNPKKEYKGEYSNRNVSFSDLANELKHALGPAQLADLVFRAAGVWAPLKPLQKVSPLKIAGLMMVLVGAVIVIYMMKTMGWF